MDEEELYWYLTGSSARKLKRAGVDLLGGRAQERRMHPFMAAELVDDFVAIEVKHSNRVARNDLSALKLFKRDYPDAKCVLLYRGEERRLVDDVLITGVEQFLRELVPGCLKP